MSKIIEKNTFKWYNISIKIQEEKNMELTAVASWLNSTFAGFDLAISFTDCTTVRQEDFSTSFSMR